MPSPIQLNRLMRRYGRLAAAAAALLGVLAVVATAHAASMSIGDHDHDGHAKNAVAVCVAVGGCVLVVAATAVAVHRLLQRSVWNIPAPLTPAIPWVPAPGRFLARAGPPPLLQVFQL